MNILEAIQALQTLQAQLSQNLKEASEIEKCLNHVLGLTGNSQQASKAHSKGTKTTPPAKRRRRGPKGATLRRISALLYESGPRYPRDIWESLDIHRTTCYKTIRENKSLFRILDDSRVDLAANHPTP